jgi:hypothetical protein
MTSNEALKHNYTDSISMSRPFIRESVLVDKIKENRMDKIKFPVFFVIDAWLLSRMNFRFTVIIRDF